MLSEHMISTTEMGIAKDVTESKNRKLLDNGYLIEPTTSKGMALC